MTLEEIKNEILNRYKGLMPQKTWGETAYFYNPGMLLKKGTYFITIKEKDGENDSSSNLCRPEVFRLSTGTTKKDFEKLFREKPSRPSKGKTIEGPFKFDEKDVIMLHPVYGWLGWVSVLNPSKKTFEDFLKIADNYYEEAVKRFNQKTK
jgi:hypothetical protein